MGFNYSLFVYFGRAGQVQHLLTCPSAVDIQWKIYNRRKDETKNIQLLTINCEIFLIVLAFLSASREASLNFIVGRKAAIEALFALLFALVLPLGRPRGRPIVNYL